MSCYLAPSGVSTCDRFSIAIQILRESKLEKWLFGKCSPWDNIVIITDEHSIVSYYWTFLIIVLLTELSRYDCLTNENIPFLCNINYHWISKNIHHTVTKSIINNWCIWFYLYRYEIIREELGKIEHTKYMLMLQYIRNFRPTLWNLTLQDRHICHIQKINIFSSTYPNFPVQLFPFVVQGYSHPKITKTDISNDFLRWFFERRCNKFPWCTHDDK